MKNYKIYTLSIDRDIRYVGVTTNTLKARLYQHRYNARNPKRRSTPVSKWIYSIEDINGSVVFSNQYYNENHVDQVLDWLRTKINNFNVQVIKKSRKKQLEERAG